MLAGVILAGGKSSRMGTDKSLLTLPDNNKSLLEHSQSILATVCANNVFISGTQHKQGIADIVGECGPLSGIHAAINFLGKNHTDVSELLFIPVDMPNLRSEDFQHLIKKGRESQTLCCFDNCFLPLYVPLSHDINQYLDLQLLSVSDGDDTLHAKKQYSIHSMFEFLKGLQVPPLKDTQLNNINTHQQWQKHCVEKHLLRYKHDYS